MKTLIKAMVVLLTVSLFFACETEDVLPPSNPSAPSHSPGIYDSVEEDKIFRNDFGKGSSKVYHDGK